MALRTASARSWVVLLGVAAIAVVVRLVAFNEPARTVFDEAWYARDGCYYWLMSAEACGMGDAVAPDRDVATWLATYGELTPEHPPLGKWLIGLPMAVLGYIPGAWRLTAVAAGCATVVLVVLLGRRAFGSVAIGGCVGVLLGVDFLHVVQSRLAMLDVFMVLMAAAALYFALRDRDQLPARTVGAGHRRWMLAAGLAGGAATATKLAGVGVPIAVLAATAAWEAAAWRTGARHFPSLVRGLFWVALLLVVVPLATYLVTYVGRLDGAVLEPPWIAGSWLGAWIDRQAYMLEFYASNPITTQPASWLPMLEEGMPYLLDQGPDGVRAIVLFGNPVVWWAGLVGLLVALGQLLTGRSRLGAQVVAIAFAASVPGWLLPMVAGRPVHLYHAVPFAVGVCLAVGFLVSLVPSTRTRTAVTTVIASGAIVAFAIVAPMLMARPLAPDQWQARACIAASAWPQPSAITESCPAR
jgi:dolichyl-phosphate-mannose-protein mannosyltransferase